MHSTYSVLVMVFLGSGLAQAPLVSYTMLALSPSTPMGSSTAARWTARAVQLSLLLFIVVEPLLGVLMAWAEGNAMPIPLTSWDLPALLVLGGWEDTLEELHEDIGNLFYAVIGLHVLASLWHHFVRRDDVLRRML